MKVRRIPLVFAAASVGLALWARAAPAQSVLDAARSAQRRFEAERVRLLPGTGARPEEACDQRIGRMCLSDDDWWPTPENPRIAAAREELLATLAGLAGLDGDARGEPWVLGQRVVYLGEAGRWDAAYSLAAAACAERPEPWCQQLRGLALHELGRFVEAERAFRMALDGLDPDSARAWLDPEPLLDAQGRSWIRAAKDRALAAARVWSLADPLLLVPGNDRLTEHLARRTVASVRATARSTYNMAWNADFEETLIRYGWEIGWERADNRSFGSIGADVVVGHHDPESRPLMPPGAILPDPAGAPAGSWTPDFRRARATYAPAYASAVLPADAQIAVFPRGERFVLVGAVALPEDTTEHARHAHPGRAAPRAPWRGMGAASGLFLISEEAAPLEARAPERSAALVLEAPAGRWVASVESWDPAVRRAGRTRAGVVVPRRRPDEPTLSDLLLVDGTVTDGESLDAAARRALPSVRVRRGQRVGVVWELFGLAPSATDLAYRLTLERRGSGVLRRAARALGLLRAPRARALEWQEERPPGSGPALRGVELDLGELDAGRWSLRLEVRLEAGGPLVAEREIVLEEGPEA